MKLWSYNRQKKNRHIKRDALDLIILGSSSSEAFDYAIGPNPTYHPFWAGAWSARGLKNEPMRQYIYKIMNPFERDSYVMLNFGLADVIFNARYKAVTEGFYDFKRLVAEAAEAIISTKNDLLKMGYSDIIGTFIAPVTPHDQSYWYPMGPGRQLPNEIMGQMYHDIFCIVSNEMTCLDTFKEMSSGSSGSYLILKDYARSSKDHHPDYIKMHEIMRSKLSQYDGMPQARVNPLDSLYPYENYFVKDLMKEGKTRPNTCR